MIIFGSKKVNSINSPAVFLVLFAIVNLRNAYACGFGVPLLAKHP
jgi:hypothetical protein